MESNTRRSLQLRRSGPYRVVNGEGDNLPGLYIDKFGGILLVHRHSNEGEASDPIVALLQREAVSLLEPLGVSSIYLRARLHDPIQSASREAQCIAGDPVEEVTISENGMRAFIRPGAQVDGGFFIDMREVRNRVRAIGQGKRVLNLFSFTGTLGISGLLGGASEVVQVDLSKSVLRWAQENFELNRDQISGTMRVIAEDALTFIKRELRRREKGTGEPYDLIILDPPSYSGNRKGPFQIERDLPRLIQSALSLLPSSRCSDLMVTNNHSRLSLRETREMVCSLLQGCNFQYRIEALKPPSEDFPGTSRTSMKGVWVTIDPK